MSLGHRNTVMTPERERPCAIHDLGDRIDDRQDNMTTDIHRILVPTDLTASSDHAIDYACRLAGQLGASIHLVHVLDRPFPPQLGWAPAIEAAAMRERLREEERAAVAALASRLQRCEVPVSSEVRGGIAADAIVQAAIDHQADLIVMATHARTGLSHAVLGSVTEHVIRRATCPVLAVSARQRQSADATGAPPTKVA